MKTPFRRIATLALSVAAIAGCAADQPTAVSSRPTVSEAAPTQDLLGGVVGVVASLVTVNGIQRTTPLAAPITVSKSIGREGGLLAIPAAGVTVVVPPGALSAPTTITMTARAGTLVAYDFAPHGITFARPLVFNQQLRGTNVTILSAPFLKLGYYKDGSLLTKTTAVVSELLSGLFDVLSWTFTAPIQHFSGYVVTCGRGG
jgi:hypothetical protein